MSTFRVRLNQGSLLVNGGAFGVAGLDTVANYTVGITGATNATPIVVTTGSPHRLTTGQSITISGVLGNTATNGSLLVVDKLSETTFSIRGSSGNGTYTSGGTVTPNSIQRTLYAPGPNNTFRKLVDGATFDDCNYWKKYAIPNVLPQYAFIEVVTDDGSPYVDGMDSTFPIVYNLVVAPASTYAANVADILTDHGGYAKFVQVVVTNEDVNMRINGTAVINIPANTTQTFNSGDLLIGKLEFDNSDSGATTATVQILAGVMVMCNS